MSDVNYESYFNGLRDLGLEELRAEYKRMRADFIELHFIGEWKSFFRDLSHEDFPINPYDRGKKIISLMMLEHNKLRFEYAMQRWFDFRVLEGIYQDFPDVNEIEGWDESLSWKVKYSLVCKQIAFEEEVSESYCNYLYEKDY